MSSITLTVNETPVEAVAEPRTSLADFVRDRLDLTGTHLGCEHGVCGACTLLIDDMPARSCITFAASCDGARVITIEGLDDDEIATELRTAFTREHALQCGYCTPGMLISARDLVLRLDTANERAIRVGLSGNLCRCTGYVGIVRAVRAVIEDRRKRGIRPITGAGRDRLGPVGSGNGTSVERSKTTWSPASSEVQERSISRAAIPDFVPDRVFERHFTVASPPDTVFAMFGDIRQVAACLPGVSLTGDPTPEHVEGVIRVRLGPISAGFRGTARIERDPSTLSGQIVGRGDDQHSRSHDHPGAPDLRAHDLEPARRRPPELTRCRWADQRVQRLDARSRVDRADQRSRALRLVCDHTGRGRRRGLYAGPRLQRSGYRPH